jgi:glycosyltransferase involved in cell wall biosynthesis
MQTEELQPLISIVIPCYNEERNLERGVLNEVYEYLAKQSYSWEVIIVNDESTDNSRNLIEHFIEDKVNFCLLDISVMSL